VETTLKHKVGRKKALISGIAVMGFAVLVLGIFASVDNSEVSGKPCTEYTNHLMKHNSTNNNNTNVTDKDLNQIVVIANSEEINTCPEATTSKSLRIIAFLALVTYVCAYSFGFGPITWILLSEIFPPSIKGRAMATVTSINWALNFGVSATFVEMSAAFSVGGLYICYAILCLLSVIFVIFVIPETRQKSLEDVSKTLKDTKICGFCSHSSTKKTSYSSYSILGSSTTLA
jgi:MFS family permease